MNGKTFAFLARAFNGVAAIGNLDSVDGLAVVHVIPGIGEALPSHDKVRRALDLADQIESRLGITVVVKTDPAPLPGIAG